MTVKRIELVAERLYLALKSRPCNCQGKFQKGNWEITLICSRCIALEQYEIIREVN